MSEKFCPYCKNSLGNDERFCRLCGTEKESQAQGPVFALSYSSIAELRRGSSGFGFIEMAILMAILVIVGAIFYPNYRKCYRQQNRGKACYANMRILLGAIEMYNMDHETKINYKVDDPTREDSLLVKERYLKSPLTKPDTDCSYSIAGDVTRDGFIKCSVHGQAEEPAEQ
ncbi:MAG: hypothetical protein ACOYXC_03240 [Candidatus Rifleibacteriota bacterium]